MCAQTRSLRNGAYEICWTSTSSKPSVKNVQSRSQPLHRVVNARHEVGILVLVAQVNSNPACSISSPLPFKPSPLHLEAPFRPPSSPLQAPFKRPSGLRTSGKRDVTLFQKPLKVNQSKLEEKQKRSMENMQKEKSLRASWKDRSLSIVAQTTQSRANS